MAQFKCKYCHRTLNISISGSTAVSCPHCGRMQSVLDTQGSSDQQRDAWRYQSDLVKQQFDQMKVHTDTGRQKPRAGKALLVILLLSLLGSGIYLAVVNWPQIQSAISTSQRQQAPANLNPGISNQKPDSDVK